MRNILKKILGPLNQIISRAIQIRHTSASTKEEINAMLVIQIGIFEEFEDVLNFPESLQMSSFKDNRFMVTVGDT